MLTLAFKSRKISERFWQFYFFTKRSTLLVKTSRKLSFCIHFPYNKMQNCYLFCLCLSFRIKVKKRYLLLKKKSGIFSFRVNDILTSILSALHPFLASPNDVLKRRKRYLFFGFKRCHERHKKVPFLQLEVFSKAGIMYLY